MIHFQNVVVMMSLMFGSFLLGFYMFRDRARIEALIEIHQIISRIEMSAVMNKFDEEEIDGD